MPPFVTPSLAVSNCSLPRSPLPVRDGSLCSVPACAACGRLLPSLLLIGSIKTGSTLLWGRLVDYSEGAIDTGRTTDKGYISKKEKDFFGDPAQWRRGRGWYERAWPKCPASGARTVVGIDATPAYHVWYDAPKNMAAFYGRALGQLRLVWMLRDPVRPPHRRPPSSAPPPAERRRAAARPRRRWPSTGPISGSSSRTAATGTGSPLTPSPRPS